MQLLVIAEVLPSSLIHFNLMVEVTRSSETSALDKSHTASYPIRHNSS
jgi:hypothetical protein